MPEQVIAGRYRLLERLGTGAMAQIWLARDLELERRVAVKILRPDAERDRFTREARAVAGLSHPNVCRLYDFGETGDGPYMVLEYLPGGSLDDRLRNGAALADDETRRIASNVAAGLAHAHGRGLVHRDVKPANVLFDEEGHAKIADFGIVLPTDSASLTETGTILGTATYISPEQAAGEPATPASDVYSYGAVLFHMLTGRPPFESASAIDLVRRHRVEPPPSVLDVRPDAPPDLAALADASLAKDPAARPRDGVALLTTLGGAAATTVLPPLPLEGPPTLVIPRTRPSRRGGPSRRVVLAVTAAVLLLASGIALAVVATRGDSGGSEPTLPPVTTAPTTAPTTATGTTEQTTTAATTTEPTTTATTAPATEPTTAPTTTAPTTAPTTTPTTVPTTAPTTAPTTEPVTTTPTDTSATTTAGTLTQ